MIKNVKKIALLLTLVLGLSAVVNAQTKTAIKIADLQKGITDNIAQNYPGYKIKDAFKIENSQFQDIQKINLNKIMIQLILIMKI